MENQHSVLRLSVSFASNLHILHGSTVWQPSKLYCRPQVEIQGTNRKRSQRVWEDDIQDFFSNKTSMKGKFIKFSRLQTHCPHPLSSSQLPALLLARRGSGKPREDLGMPWANELQLLKFWSEDLLDWISHQLHKWCQFATTHLAPF